MILETDQVNSASKPKEIKNTISSIVFAVWVNASKAANESSYKPLENDPVWFIENSNNQEILDALGELSSTSTRTYIRCFLQSMNYLVKFEEKALWAYLHQTHNKVLKIVLSLIYLVENKVIDKKVFDTLHATVNDCSYEDACKAYNMMRISWLVWDDDTLNDEIFKEFYRKATFSPARPRLVA